MATSDSPRSVTNVTLAVARGNAANAPGILSITGSGFGVAPNVILYRTMREATFDPAVAPAGEVGVMSGSNRQAQFDGRGAFAGHDPATGGKASVEFVAASQFRKFRHYVNISVPDGKAMPGSDGTARTFATSSDWKPVWAMLGGSGNSTSDSPDFAIPSHVGDANFAATGNSINLGTFRWISYDPSKWSWNAFNGFGLILNADDADPVGTPADQALHLTSAAANTAFTTKSVPGYQGNATVTNATAFYDRIKYSGYANNTPLNNAQAYYCDAYLAVESSPGAEDFKQAVALGNASTIAACTHLQMKKADSWTDSQIDLSIDDYEANNFSHYFVFGPADGITVIKSGSIA